MADIAADGPLRTPATVRLPSLTRREQIRRVAAGLFAAHGFHGVTIEQIGSACGMSGPAVYRHFPSKEAVLADLLVGISEYLLAGGRSVVATCPPAEALPALVDFHLSFALDQPDLIRVQDRDLPHLGEQARRVRRLQRAYVEVWSGALARLRPDLDPSRVRVRTHAVFGLMNSTPHSAAGPYRAAAREVLSDLALAALLA